MLENDSAENSNDESATVTQSQLDEWAGLPADEIASDQGESQSEDGDTSSNEDAAALTAEEIMEGVTSGEPKPGDEQPQGDSGMVEAINGLGLVHNNIPFELKDTDQVIEFLQKGYNYTQDKQALAAEKDQAYKEYDDKVEELQKEYNDHSELLNKAQVFDYALKNMEEADPDLYDQVMSHVNGSTQAFNNPVVADLQSKYAALEQKLSQTTELSESKSIVGGFERDLSSFQKEIAPAANKLGLTSNWDNVKDMWKDSNGKMTVKQAFYAVHGEDIQKLRASKQTVADTTRKAAAAKKIPSAATTAGSKAGGGSSEDYSGMSLEQTAMAIAFGR